MMRMGLLVGVAVMFALTAARNPSGDISVTPVGGGGGNANVTYPLAGSADSAAAPDFAWAASPSTGLFSPGANLCAASVNGAEVMRWTSAGAQLAAGKQLQCANGTAASPCLSFSGATSTGVYWDNANNLLGLASQANQVLLLNGNESGNGSSATLAGSSFSDSSAPILRFAGAQSLMAYPDALWVRTGDGSTASQIKAKNVYTTSADATSGDAISGWNGHVAAGALRSFRFYNSSRITDLGDGIIQLFNNASSGFSKLYFGPYTSSFPMLKVNGGGLLVRTGDDLAGGTLGAGATSVTTLSTSGLATLASSSVTGNESVGGRMLVANGTAAAPAFSFTNSTGTGWYYDGASLVASVAGTQVAYFTPPSYNQGLFLNGGAGAGVMLKTLGTNQLYLRNGGDTGYTALNAGRFMTIATATSATATGFSGQSAGQGVYFPTSSTMGLSNNNLVVAQYDSAGTTSSVVPLVTAITAATYTTTRADSFTTLTNTGSTVSLNVNLATTPDLGTSVRAVKTAAQTFTITAGGSSKFSGPSGGTSYTVLTLSNVGTAVNLQWVGTGWQVTSMVNAIGIN